jgi:carboxymethylenebutenolidase
VHGANAMRLHIFRPAMPGRFPGIVLFSEIYQVTAPIRRLAAFVAGLGHVVAVPEVYHEFEPTGTVLAYDQAGTDRGNALKTTKSIAAFDEDSKAALGFLQAYENCTGRLGTMGVCFGGHLAYRAALDPRVSAAACFYATDIHTSTLGAGKADDSLLRMTELKAEALFVWGRQDPHVPFAGRQYIRDRLEAAGATYEWHEVNAAHAFLRDEGPRYDPALFLRMMTLLNDFFRRVLHI